MLSIAGSGLKWLEIPEEELHLLELAQAEREETEKYLALLVAGTIEGVRKGDQAHTPNIPLLISSLMEVMNPRKNNGFGAWNARIGKVLGIDRCRQIGAQVCSELKFTLQEALELHDKYPHEDSFMELLTNRYKSN